MQWHYVENGKQAGPVSEDDLKALVDSGKITSETLVWHDGMQDWVAYGSVTGESSGSKAEPAPAPAAATEAAPAATEADKPTSFQYQHSDEEETGGNTPNAELMARARTCLSGLWALSVGVFLVYQLITIAVSCVPVVGGIISFLITGALAVGSATFFLAVGRQDEPNFSMLFHGFSRFGTSLGAYFFMVLFIVLWSLLLIVPGIIASLAYAMTFYIVADDPSVGGLEAIKRSKAMMQGRKWKFFCLNLRFIGWSLLCVFTFGIGFLWLGPYISTSIARFYDDG